MHLAPILHAVNSALTGQAALAGDDPSVEAAADQLVAALQPALRQAAYELAEQAAGELAAQLPDRAVDVALVDGEPVLRVTDAPQTTSTTASDEDFAARLTLRLPASLKQLVEDAAAGGGDSVNGWVVDALSKFAHKAERRGGRVTDSFDL